VKFTKVDQSMFRHKHSDFNLNGKLNRGRGGEPIVFG